jgi:hypothetical protein
MLAATSPIGAFTDPPLVGVATAILLVIAVPIYRSVLNPEQVFVIYLAAGLPVGVAAIAWLSLLGARKKVVTWLAGLPFPVENVNSLLAGVGQNLVIRFAEQPPDRDALNERLEQVHPDCFALEYADEEPEVEVRIGVLDSKYNPVRATYRRYARAQRLMAEALVPLSGDHPIEVVHVS